MSKVSEKDHESIAPINKATLLLPTANHDIIMLVTITKPAKNASADYIWTRLAEFSDFAWHPEIKESRDIGSIPDGSANMIGAVRLLTKHDGAQLKEVITEWSDKNRSQTFTIEGNLPPPVRSLTVTFKVRQNPNGDGALVDCIANVQVKPIFCLLAPILKVVLPKKLGPIVQGIANIKQV